MNLALISESLNAVMIDTAQFMQKQKANFEQTHVSSKGLNQLVSFVDIETEKYLVKALNNILPNAGFITEENTSEIGPQSYNWIIDPLDGTTNFIHGVPVYSISVALAQNNTILVGAVYEIGRQELFHAYLGGGAFLNGEAIKVSPCINLQNSLMATGFPYYDFEQMSQYIDVLKHLMKNTHGLRRMGSAAVDLAYVACGRFDGFFEYGLHAWDVAAGCLLVSEAGGQLSDFKRRDNYVYGDSIIASNGHLQVPLQDIIEQHFA
jgi:myo-inositol-1(or 4)-monophosphatase